MGKRLYGSLTNRLMENGKPPVPKVGMGATILMFSDRHACTVIGLQTKRMIVIQEDTQTRTDKNGMSESQEYAYAADNGGEKHTVSLRKDGRWKIAKSETVVRLGERDAYHDYSF